MSYYASETIPVIAIAYEKAKDEFDTIPQEQIHLFREFINEQFAFISTYISPSFRNQIYFDFVTTDPYKYDKIEEVKPDFKDHLIKVNVSGNDSKLWGPVYNLMFRAIHDYIHAEIHLDFNFMHEVIAYDQQVGLSKQIYKKYLYSAKYKKLNWELYENVLRSEIIYQAAYKEHFDTFHLPEQKIILKNLLHE